MSNLEKRMRTIMRREKLSYQQVSEYADVSTQAVHKWLSKGSISDEKAKELAEQIGFDWLWLKYGLNRIPLESLHDVVMASTNNMLLTRWNDLAIIAASDSSNSPFDYQREDIIGKTLLDFMPNTPEQTIRMGQKLIYALSGMVEHSFRCTVQDKFDQKTVQVNCKGITTDSEGITYELSQIEIVVANGTEDSASSLRLHRKTGLDLSPEEIDALAQKYPQWPKLKHDLHNK